MLILGLDNAGIVTAHRAPFSLSFFYSFFFSFLFLFFFCSFCFCFLFLLSRRCALSFTLSRAVFAPQERPQFCTNCTLPIV